MAEPEVSREDCERAIASSVTQPNALVPRLARTCLALYDREDELLRGIAARERKYQAAKAEAARMTEKFRAARAERDALTQEVERLQSENAALLSGDYCEHGVACPGTGPDCAKAGTLAQARERGWNEGVAWSDVGMAARLSTALGVIARLRDGWEQYDENAAEQEWCNARVVGITSVEHDHEPMSRAEVELLLREVGNA